MSSLSQAGGGIFRKAGYIQPTWGRFDLLPLPLRARGSAGIRLRLPKHTTPGLIHLTTQEAWLALVDNSVNKLLAGEKRE